MSGDLTGLCLYIPSSNLAYTFSGIAVLGSCSVQYTRQGFPYEKVILTQNTRPSLFETELVQFLVPTVFQTLTSLQYVYCI